MQHLYIRKAGIAAFKCGFVAFGLLAIWLLGGIAEDLGPWWLYILASVGSFAVGAVLLGADISEFARVFCDLPTSCRNLSKEKTQHEKI